MKEEQKALNTLTELFDIGVNAEATIVEMSAKDSELLLKKGFMVFEFGCWVIVKIFFLLSLKGC